MMEKIAESTRQVIPSMTPDACERQAGRIVAAILSRFDVRRQ